MKLLIVEDHASIRSTLTSYLTSRGFVVDAVATAQEALERLSRSAFSAMILDLGLPDTSGVDLLRRIRSDGMLDLPVVIATARDDLQSKLTGLDAGADEYLVKPFPLAELDARLRAVLRRPGTRTSPVYRFADLTFDTSSRTTRVGTRVLSLTRGESILLATLLRAGGAIVIRDEIEQCCASGTERMSFDATNALVVRLRAKLLAAHSAVQITTVRGIGYRLATASSIDGF